MVWKYVHSIVAGWSEPDREKRGYEGKMREATKMAIAGRGERTTPERERDERDERDERERERGREMREMRERGREGERGRE
jgi:hypothetical protein